MTMQRITLPDNHVDPLAPVHAELASAIQLVQTALRGYESKGFAYLLDEALVRMMEKTYRASMPGGLRRSEADRLYRMLTQLRTDVLCFTALYDSLTPLQREDTYRQFLIELGGKEEGQ